MSSWSDAEGLTSLLASLAETHEDRLYVFESTARGFNMFFDMWEKANRAHSQMAIFIGWWTNEAYRIERDDPRFDIYVGTETGLNEEEKTWVGQVKKLYDYDIQPEQIAWWRWKFEEQIHDLNLMYQEFPPTEEYAFILSGAKFFPATKLTDDYKEARVAPYWSFKYLFGEHFFQTDIAEAHPKIADLKVWEFPEPTGIYVIGADPAYGQSSNSDAFCAQVLRCCSDRVVQVAEFRSPYITTIQFAWVLAHLCGAYRGLHGDCKLNLEIKGGGTAVYNELENLKRIESLLGNKAADTAAGNTSLRHITSHISYFIHYRPESVSGRYAFHFNTTQQTKKAIMNTFRDYYAMNTLRIHSAELLGEMRYTVQGEAGIETEGAKKDDRVMAMALALYAWQQWVYLPLFKKGHTYNYAMELQKKGNRPENFVDSLVSGYLKQASISMQDRR